MAGSAAAIDNGIGVVGVAPGARLTAVRVLDDSGSGSMGAVAAGVDYVTDEADRIEVANMSLGSQVVSVSDESGDFGLSATGYKVKGRHHADLSWSGATSTHVDVYRDGSVIETTANDGEHTDATNDVGGGSHTYQVCEAGTSTCSNEATVTF